MKLTPFGKALRKLRIDHGLLLAQMAEALEVSAAFLSNVEMGKKSIPYEILDRIIEIYHLNDEQENELRDAADASARSVTLKPTTPEQSKFATALARRLNNMDDDDIEKIWRTMGKVLK
jgi:transcriptional regulator with XRE-family HTH domain